jgi:hypothetical protein
MLGVALLVALILVAVGITWRMGFPVGRIIRCGLGVLVGGGLCAVPGIVCSLLAVAGAASGASPVPAWPVVLSVSGNAAGTFAGLLIADRARSRPRPPRAWATALAGYPAGAALSFLALVLVQESDWETAWLVLSPLSTASATLAGYALLAARP